MLQNKRMPLFFVNPPIHFRISFREGLVDNILNYIIREIQAGLRQCSDHHALHLRPLDEALVRKIVEPEGEINLIFDVGVGVEYGKRACELRKLKIPLPLGIKKLKHPVGEEALVLVVLLEKRQLEFLLVHDAVIHPHTGNFLEKLVQRLHLAYTERRGLGNGFGIGQSMSIVVHAFGAIATHETPQNVYNEAASHSDDNTTGPRKGEKRHADAPTAVE